MARRIRYHPLFECDVREAAGWYDQRSAGLGNAFVDVVRQCTAAVIADPQRFAKSPAGCRYIRLPRFPYVLLFDLVEEELLMFGVLHTARSMEKWRERQSPT
ncbi:MAG TPA: type II toxin-antitoxin system RelE/ParE family toxin [Thermoguttaceae bacterium]|nr:type II toxin-antitoxin system RelE/ParE family toxin [Thermoguttaceae bacterium]